MSVDINQVAGYYDHLTTEQLASGVNDRIYHLYRRVRRLGLKPNANILELGCGIGTLTYLLSGCVKKGRIEAVDISPASVEFARQRVRQPGVSFVAADVVEHQPAMGHIDLITLFDILEHIPAERHRELFRNIALISGEHTKVLINIPSPASVLYDQQHNPAALQIIDQPLPLALILDNIEKNGLSLVFFETYSIWAENDYQFFVVEKQPAFKEVKLSTKRSFFQKALKKLERTYVKLRYPFKKL